MSPVNQIILYFSKISLLVILINKIKTFIKNVVFLWNTSYIVVFYHTDYGFNIYYRY